jgi:hypothetical protein
MYLVHSTESVKNATVILGTVLIETFLCSISALHLKTVLKDVHQLLMLSAGTLMYLKQILFPLVIFYNNCGTIHILDTDYI